MCFNTYKSKNSSNIRVRSGVNDRIAIDQREARITEDRGKRFRLKIKKQSSLVNDSSRTEINPVGGRISSLSFTELRVRFAA